MGQPFFPFVVYMTPHAQPPSSGSRLRLLSAVALIACVCGTADAAHSCTTRGVTNLNLTTTTGFHSLLTARISVDVAAEVGHGCYALRLDFPSEFFVDVNELRAIPVSVTGFDCSASRVMGPHDTLVAALATWPASIDLEQPAYLMSHRRHALFLAWPLTVAASASALCRRIELELQGLPVHSRYLAPFTEAPTSSGKLRRWREANHVVPNCFNLTVDAVATEGEMRLQVASPDPPPLRPHLEGFAASDSPCLRVPVGRMDELPAVAMATKAAAMVGAAIVVVSATLIF